MSATDVEGVAVKVDFEAENNQKKVQIENPVPMQVEFKNLEFSVPVKIKSKSTDQNEKSKKILQNISGRFKSGSLTAVMGASGAGKTSLLSLIAGEVTSGSVSGEISVNGESIGLKTIKKISGFVFQDDLILGTMTVKEAISMSATLRLPKEMSAEEKNKRVEDIIALLSLGKCQDTPIGNAYLKGISGGERKRTAIAMELITNPSLLFLDEPTSGLDTYTAHSVIKTLKGLAAMGKTIVATIHQPSSDIFFLFDELLLLSQGQVMYQGSIQSVVSYFARFGYQCPQYTNPSDYIFMNILNEDESLTKNGSDNANLKLLEKWHKTEESYSIMTEIKSASKEGELKLSKKAYTEFTTQFKFLFNRASKNAFRNPLMIKTYFFQSVFFAVLIGLIYLNLDEKKGASAVQDRTGVLFFLAINQVFSNAFGVLSIFGEEKGVFRREYGARYYSLPSYFLAKVSVELPFQFIFPILMGSIIYFMVGVQATVGKFLIFNGFLILCALCGFALGVCFGCIFTSLPVALAVTPLVLLPLMLFSGLLLNQGSIPVYVDWIKYIAPMKWGFSALAINEYSGLTIFTNSGTSISGEEIIRELALDDAYMTISTAAAVLSLMVIILMGLAYLALYRETIQASRTVKLVKSSFTAEIQHEEEETP